MAARAMWKGVIRLGKAGIPVKLYAAVQDRTVHFNILDKHTRKRVRQRMVTSDSNEEVPPSEINKGFETSPGEFVIVKADDVAGLRPAESRDIAVSQFVKVGSLAPQWFNRPYYLGPDTASKEEYFGLAKALSEEKAEAVASWVMRNKRYTGVLHAEGDYLMLISLHFAEEVLAARDLPTPEGRELDQREVAMAKQLIEALKGEYDPEQFSDDYREQVVKLVEAKAAGRKPRLQSLPKPKHTESLANALQASLKATTKRSAA